MPAILDDPAAPTIYRSSGQAPFPDPHDLNPALPVDVYSRQVTLRDRVTIATVVPFSSRHQVPASLMAYLSDQFNKEIEMGDTYPMIDPMTLDKFAAYWFQNFGAVMLLGNIESPEEVIEGKDWARECLGSFYIKPNYPGRSSHVCNAGFLVTDAARGRGVGRLMGESYLEWAPRLGYTYSVFNLVYETNVASCRIWDALGFKRIGRVKGAGNLKSYPGQLIDAIIYGRDLGPEGSDFVSEERFDKIKFYLKYGTYPAGADRAEKSRLRSAATHYKLLDNDKLMLKDKEVISDPQRQYEIARNVHVLHHGGINKTTASIAEKFHWVRIKETVSLVIRNCAECKELGKAPVVRADGVIRSRSAPHSSFSSSVAAVAAAAAGKSIGVSAAGRILSLPQHHDSSEDSFPEQAHIHHGSVSPQVLNRTLPHQSSQSPSSRLQSHLRHQHRPPQNLLQHTASHAPLTPMATSHHSHHSHPHNHSSHSHAHQNHHHHQNIREDYIPLDPQIMEDVRTHLGSYNRSRAIHSSDPSLPSDYKLPSHHDPHDDDPHHHHPLHHHSPNPLDHDHHNHDAHSPHHHPSPDPDSDSFQALLAAGRDHGSISGGGVSGDEAVGHGVNSSHGDEDLDMLIDQEEDEEGAEVEEERGGENREGNGKGLEIEEAAQMQMRAREVARGAEEALKGG